MFQGIITKTATGTGLVILALALGAGPASAITPDPQTDDGARVSSQAANIRSEIADLRDVAVASPQPLPSDGSATDRRAIGLGVGIGAGVLVLAGGVVTAAQRNRRPGPSAHPA